MSRKIDLAYILAYDAEMPMRKLLSEKYDKNASSFEDLELKINQVIANEGDEAIKELAMFHPDRDLILSTYTPPVVEAKTVEVKSNCCGMTSSFDAEKTSNCAGNPNCGCNKGKNLSYEGSSNFGGMTKDQSINILAILGIVAVVGIILKK